MKSLFIKNLSVLCVGYNDMELQRLGFLFNGVDFEGNSYKITNKKIFEEAHDFFTKHHPDLILIQDEFSKGLALCRFVRAYEGQRHTGIVFTSQKKSFIEVSETESLTSVECLERGADDFIRLNAYNKEFKARIRSIVRLKIMTDELRSANHKLRILSLTDDLTGLANMRSFYSEYNNLIRQHRNNSFGLGIIMFDLDHFKSINDSMSHLVGSRVLSEIGALLLEEIDHDSVEIAARFGGDEFIVCKKIERIDELKKIAEKLRHKIQDSVFNGDDQPVKISASFGGVFLKPGFSNTSDMPLKVADSNLYVSKRQGRNRVTLSVIDNDSKLTMLGTQSVYVDQIPSLNKKKKVS